MCEYVYKMAITKNTLYLFLTACMMTIELVYADPQTIPFFLKPSDNVYPFSWKNTTKLYISVNHTCDSIEIITFIQSPYNSSKLTQIKSYKAYNRIIQINDTYSSGQYYLFIGGIHQNSTTCRYSLTVKSNSSIQINRFLGTILDNYFFQSVDIGAIPKPYNNLCAQIVLSSYNNSNNSNNSNNNNILNGQVCGRLANSNKQIKSYQNTDAQIYYDGYLPRYFQPFRICSQLGYKSTSVEVVYVRSRLQIKFTYKPQDYTLIVTLTCTIGPIVIFIIVLISCAIIQIRRRKQLQTQLQLEQWQNRKSNLIDKNKDLQYSPLQRSQIGISCSICLQDNCDSGLPCFHLFHQICIKVWLTKRTDCPICRREYRIADIITGIMD